jgi:hypothetical protein
MVWMTLNEGEGQAARAIGSLEQSVGTWLSGAQRFYAVRCEER